MATERPNIISVKNDVLQVTPPFIDGTPVTYLTDDPDASDTALTVKDNDGFNEDDYVIIEPIGNKKAEIKRITDAVTAGTALTVAALTFDHPIGTKITLVRYDQVEIYRSATSDDTSPTIIGSAESIDVANGYNEIEATATNSFYYARYKDSNASTYSEYSDSVAAAGLGPQARGEIKKEFLSIYNEKIDNLITDEWLNRAINRWQRDLSKRRKQWSVLRATDLTDTVQDQQRYALPDDIQDEQSSDAIVSVKIADKRELGYIDQETFLRFTADHIGSEVKTAFTGGGATLVIDDSTDFADPSSGTASINIQGDSGTYTTNTESTATLTGVSDLDDNHSINDEVWQTYTSGQPNYYTIDKDKIKLYPIPNSTASDLNIIMEYWKKFPDLSDDADETLFRFPENCYLYLNWQAAIRRRLSDDIQTLRRAEWRQELENLVAEDPDFRDIRIEPRNIYYSPY